MPQELSTSDKHIKQIKDIILFFILKKIFYILYIFFKIKGTNIFFQNQYIYI